MNLLEALINSIRLPELRNKILFTGGILVVFRLFSNIAIPEANKTALGRPAIISGHDAPRVKKLLRTGSK